MVISRVNGLPSDPLSINTNSIQDSVASVEPKPDKDSKMMASTKGQH